MVFIQAVSLFFLITATVSVYGHQKKIVIENKKTGRVLETLGKEFGMTVWNNRESQLWILEPQVGSGYKIRNVASGSDIGCGKPAIYVWMLDTQNETRMETERRGIFLWGGDTVSCTFNADDSNTMWIFIEQSKKMNMKFSIENKRTREVLEDREGSLEMRRWANKNSQMWTLKPQNKSGYSIVNVATERVLTYSKNGMEYDIFILKNRIETWIHIQQANVFLVNKNGKPVFLGHKQSDGSDKWFLVQRENNTVPKRLYVDDDQDKFVIENKKTGMVLSVPLHFLEITEWEDRDYQLWTLEAQNISGHFIIHNVANGGVLTYDGNNTDYQIWKLNSQGETLIQVKGTNISLAHRDGEAIFINDNQLGDEARWILVDQSSKRANTKPKPIYIGAQRSIDVE